MSSKHLWLPLRVFEEPVGSSGDDCAVEERLAVAQLGEADLGLEVVLELLHVEVLGRHDLDVGRDHVGRRLLRGPQQLSARFSVISKFVNSNLG